MLWRKNHYSLAKRRAREANYVEVTIILCYLTPPLPCERRGPHCCRNMSVFVFCDRT